MKTVLVIEDNPEILENTTEILLLAGYKVITAEDGGEGIKKATQSLPDLVLCDIMMPGIDGYEVLRQLKCNAMTSAIPFIYVTASVEKSEMRKAINLGADGYVQKPFDIGQLTEAIDKCLAGK